MGILQFESVNCKDCCKCIGVCPVKAIEVKNHRAMIVERDCILCGNCTIACPQHTKHGTDESASVKELIRSGRKVIASVAPSYAAYFDGCGFEALRTALKGLGFYDARETAEGAYIVKSEYEKLIANGIKKPVISSCCTTLNLYIQKHYPDAIELLAPVLTPMQAHARVIHRDEPGAAVVFIGPCISKKAECEQEESELEYAITFDELDDWLGEAKITIMPAAESEQRLSRFFPVSGGILKTMTQQSGVNYVAVDGPESCMAAVKDAMAGKLDGCFIEMSFCQGSCIGGPVFRNVNRSAAASYVKVAHDAAGEADFDIAPAPDMEAHFKNSRTYYMQPTEKQIAAVFKKMGKEGPEDELNCGSCGYNTCREKAIAVYQGKAEISMCLPYLKERAESFTGNIVNNSPNGFILLNEKLEIQQINRAALQMMNLPSPSDVTGEPVVRVLDPGDFFTVLESGQSIEKKRIYLSEYDRYAEETIIPDHEFHQIICILRDVTEEERVRRQKEELSRQTAEIADGVVAKQMRIVQEIASLLGETAAETKIALYKLKGSVSDE